MRARLHDPAGRRRLRQWGPAVLAAASIGAAFIAMAFGLEHLPPGVFGLYALVGALAMCIYAWPLFEGRGKPRDVALELAPGRMRIRGRGALPRTVHTRDVVGASTARLGEEISLVLVLRPAHTAPMLMRLPDEAAADAVRKALGIGSGGLGVIRWRTERDKNDTVRGWIQALWRILLVAAGLAWIEWSANAAFMFAEFAFYLGFISLMMRGRPTTSGPNLEMAPDAVYGVGSKKDGLAWQRVPYPAIRAVHVDSRGIDLEADPPHGRITFIAPTANRRRIGIDAEEKAHIAAQIQAAADRAKQPSMLEGAWARLEPLRRGGEAPRAWLARLDAIGQSLKGARDYRSALPDEQELWSALEAPDADPELRTAAARVLFVHDRDATRTRVGEVLAACRDPNAVKRIRVALKEDAEEAADGLEAFEELEAYAVARKASRSRP